MLIKSIDKIVGTPPVICGEFKDINDVANYVSRTHHSILLSGYLLYAYKGNDSIKSLVITTREVPNKFMISIFYEGYNMIFTALTLDSLCYLINDLKSDKKLKLLCDSLISKFYENMD